MTPVSSFGEFNTEQKGLGGKGLNYQNSFLKAVDQDYRLVRPWKLVTLFSDCYLLPPTFSTSQEWEYFYFKICLGKIFHGN